MLTSLSRQKTDLLDAVADLIRRERCTDCSLRQGECDFHFVDARQRLSCHVYRRCMDLCSGIAADLPALAALTRAAAAGRGIEAKDIVLSISEAFIRREDADEVRRMLDRTPLPCPLLLTPLVHTAQASDVVDIDEQLFDGYRLGGYLTYPDIPLSVTFEPATSA